MVSICVVIEMTYSTPLMMGTKRGSFILDEGRIATAGVYLYMSMWFPSPHGQGDTIDNRGAAVLPMVVLLA